MSSKYQYVQIVGMGRCERQSAHLKSVFKISNHGFVIYPGKLFKTYAFSMGNIGHIFPKYVQRLSKAIKEVMRGREKEG